ncbi:elongation factor P hydroxylase [Acinetobacter sp. WZC-1]|uniref:elongation factor P hydroxylase n=1 Tax=Acinetobacter sp. WZC-1 TaxID=3459034 RepID=UPI00403E15C3
MHQLQLQSEVITSLHSTPDTPVYPAPVQHSAWMGLQTEAQQVEWLILHFNRWFSHLNVTLIRGNAEPEYFPATSDRPARIQFAHGFFNSALHEISHWSIAGDKRRQLADLGYWYTPDGRTAEQQQLFEQVEVKPQAIEWLFATAFGRKFRVSLDNLTGEGSDGSAFKNNVHAQVQRYLNGQTKLPRDARYFIACVCACTRDDRPLQSHEFRREMLD